MVRFAQPGDESPKKSSNKEAFAEKAKKLLDQFLNTEVENLPPARKKVYDKTTATKNAMRSAATGQNIEQGYVIIASLDMSIDMLNKEMEHLASCSCQNCQKNLKERYKLLQQLKQVVAQEVLHMVAIEEERCGKQDGN